MRQKSVDMAFAQFTRMRTGVKESEAANPVDVGLFSAAAVLPGSQISTTRSYSLGAGWPGKHPNGEQRSRVELFMTGRS